MSIIPKLASSLGKNDEAPNQQLAEQVALSNDTKAVAELVENLANNDKNIQSDCIKVLYEIGERKPKLIARYAREFLALLDSTNNRLVWGAMTALDAIVPENPKLIFSSLTKIIAAADRGTAITRDHAVGILVKLAGIRQYASKSFTLLVEQLRKCPTNQLPMYAENALPIVNDKNNALFIKTLSSRLNEVEKEAKRKRIKNILHKVSA